MSTAKVSNLVVVDGGKSIYWDLLDFKERQELKKLAYSAGFGPQEFGFRTRWGFFVPEQKISGWMNWVKDTDEKTQAFVKTSLKKILGRRASINASFKQQFQTRFPKAKSAQVSEAILIVKTSLRQLNESHEHIRAFNPTWRPLMISLAEQSLSMLDQTLSQYAITVADKVFTQNLADFAREASRRTRSSLPILPPGAAKKTCETTLQKARDWNIYDDKKLEEQCKELERIITLMPSSRTRMSKENLRERQAKVALRITKVNVTSAEIMQEVNSWKALPPLKVLDKFLDTLATDKEA